MSHLQLYTPVYWRTKMFETLGHVIQGVGRKQKETNMECISKNKQQAMH